MKLYWAAKYGDGPIVTQFHNGVEQSSDKLSRDGLRQFLLIDRSGKIVCSQDLCPGRSFFYRRRTAMGVGSGVLKVIHIIGWKFEDIVNVLFVDEVNLNIESGGFLSKSKFRYPIVFNDSDLTIVT